MLASSKPQVGASCMQAAGRAGWDGGMRYLRPAFAAGPAAQGPSRVYLDVGRAQLQPQGAIQNCEAKVPS